jgi:predicted MFS family arabinose efflux permease
VGFIGFAVCVIGAGLSSSAVLTMVAMVFGGASWVVGLSSFDVTVQLSAPRWVVGRALALYQMATFGGMACGSWIWGALAERYGVTASLLIAGGVLIAGAAFGLRYALPELTSLDLDPLGR